MKKIILPLLILLGLNSYSQNTIPTTTVTGALKINDSLRVNKNITAKGEIIAKDTMRAQKDVIVDGNVIVGGKLKIDGKSTFKNDILVKKSILFDGGNEFSYNPATPSSREIYYLGSTAAKVQPYFACPNPNVNALPLFINNGAYISRVPTGSGTGSTNSSLTFYSAPWDGTGIIEVEGVSKSGVADNGLLINYFCGRNTGINVGWDLNPTTFKDGGTVFLGAKVDMQSSLKIGWTQSGAIDLNTSIEINQNGNNANGVKVNTYNTGVKAYSIMRNDGINTFVVYGDGRTQIGYDKPLAPHTDAMLSVGGTGKIACKSLYVLKPATWADFVFKKKDIEKLEDVEKYIAKNKHLPGLPSEQEVMENGYDMNEMNAKLLEKIETLYLHIISLEKEVKELKKN